MTETITRGTITCNKYLCEEGYDSNGDIGTFFDAVVYEEEIEYFTEEVINPLVEFQGPMAPAEVSTIEVVAPTVGAEEPLTSEKVQKLKVAELKVELQLSDLSKNENKAVLCN